MENGVRSGSLCYKCDGINGELLYGKSHSVINVIVLMENRCTLSVIVLQMWLYKWRIAYVKGHCVINVIV